MLAKGESTEGYIYEATVANLTLVVLVTGFEAYTKKRFIELEQEGIRPNTNDLITAFYPKKERESGIQIALEEEAKTARVSVLQHIVNRRTINFQNFDNAKLAYNKAYRVKFGELGVSSQNIDTLRSFFRYRHNIIHVSPLPGMLNPDKVPPETPVFLDKEKSQVAKGFFQEFIENLHQASLALRP